MLKCNSYINWIDHVMGWDGYIGHAYLLGYIICANEWELDEVVRLE